MADRPVPASGEHQGRRRQLPALWGGGIDGNEQLTATTGVLLIVLLAVLGVTIVRIGQLLWLHLFLGLLLLGPVLLKMASTGYRFLRYYLRAAIYRAKGPPMLALRAMGPSWWRARSRCSSPASCCCSMVHAAGGRGF